jgi:transposase
MAMQRRGKPRQGELWVATNQIVQTPGHVFYDRLNAVLKEADFDRWIEDRCRKFYAEGGRPSVPPGVFFRMIFVGFFEGLDSQRMIAWRCADSLSLKAFLGYALTEETPDHSSLTRIRQRFPLELFQEVFRFVLKLVDEQGLLKGKTVGVDSTFLEANAAMKSIVRKETGENWEQYLKGLAEKDGVPIENKADLIRYDKQRNKEGKKKVSNQEWESPVDPDARIMKMKDGTTHLAYKAEHVVDLETGAILSAEIHQATESDSGTLEASLRTAQAHLKEAGTYRYIEEVAADKGYHKGEALQACGLLNGLGIRTYVPEPESKYERKWTDKSPLERKAVENNRRRMKRPYGKELQRRRSEVVERTFAHTCETGGARRMWLRGLESAKKRYLLTAVGNNLGLVMRKLLGSGKPRMWGMLAGVFLCLWNALRALLTSPPRLDFSAHRRMKDKNRMLG